MTAVLSSRAEYDRVYYQAHRAAIREQQHINYARRSKDPAYNQNAHLRARYGLARDQIDRMLEEQKRLCGICTQPLYKFHVDHNHDTGAVRGLLCGPCNQRLVGLERPEWREKADAYLQRFP